MSAPKIVLVALIAFGALGIGCEGFSYIADTHNAEQRPIHMSFVEREHVDIPVSNGVGAILICTLLLLVRRKIL